MSAPVPTRMRREARLAPRGPRGGHPVSVAIGRDGRSGLVVMLGSPLRARSTAMRRSGAGRPRTGGGRDGRDPRTRGDRGSPQLDVVVLADRQDGSAGGMRRGDRRQAVVGAGRQVDDDTVDVRQRRPRARRACEPGTAPRPRHARGRPVGSPRSGHRRGRRRAWSVERLREVMEHVARGDDAGRAPVRRGSGCGGTPRRPSCGSRSRSGRRGGARPGRGS